ncbi:TetR/AcrR family transcriptional regulator [Streptomyces sp. NPDC087428]|uniref:TetR/AcrR family transcriptional regulator n=1 Tax=Streptomyces sp. NPDC087428 TaxID=3365788 RepID=UPI00380DEDDC
MSGTRNRTPATRLPPEARREQLIGIGLELLREHSLDELSTDEVAQRAGISRGLLFHYFANKQDFYRAVVQVECDRFLAALAVPRDTAPTAEGPGFRELIGAFVDYVLANRALYLALVRGASGSHPAVTDIVEATRTRAAEWLTQAVRRDGRAPLPHQEILSRAWMAFAEEATTSWPPGGPEAQAELTEFLETSFQRLIDP